MKITKEIWNKTAHIQLMPSSKSYSLINLTVPKELVKIIVENYLTRGLLLIEYISDDDMVKLVFYDKDILIVDEDAVLNIWDREGMIE